MPLKQCDYFLVRHLKPNVASGTCYGRSDLLADEPPDPCWQRFNQLPQPILTSPLQRASRLAEHLELSLELSLERPQTLASSTCSSSFIEIDPCWQELDFGRWEGLPWESISEQSIVQWQQNLLDFTFPEGESARQMQQRVLSGWQRWKQRQTGGTLISHLGVIRMLLGDVLAIPFQQQLIVQIDTQHTLWLRQSWMENDQGDQIPESEVWQLKGLNLSPEALLAAWS